MEIRPKFRFRALPLALALGAGGVATSAPPASAAESIEEVVVTGLRGQPRTVADSPVPVDVFNEEAINAVAYADTNDILQTLVPSYNVSRQPISDGSSFIRPAELRGLSSDKTLVLVNGKRRHRAALVVTGGSGTQGPDVAQIPSAALKSIEVLRDGASAQYGSDAIAGVINFILKDNAEGFSVTADYGEMDAGDGESTTLQGNLGLPLGESGFLSISAEYNDNSSTDRSEPYCESWFCTDLGPDPRFDAAEITKSIRAENGTDFLTNADFLADPEFVDGLARANTEGGNVQPWGQPNYEASRIFYNAGFEISENMELYSFGNYGETDSDGNFFYRYPGNGTIEDVRLPDGSIWNALSFFPGGFTPRFAGEQTDYSFLVGLRGELAGGIMYDLSARTGYNEIEYTLSNTLNPSQGPQSPTSFSPGDLSNEEFQIQADFAREFDLGGPTPATLGWGFSYMDEAYELGVGDPDSFARGPYLSADPHDFCSDGDFGARTVNAGAPGNITEAMCNNRDPIFGQAVDPFGDDLTGDFDGDGVEDEVSAGVYDPIYRQVPAGSNGFPGYAPESAIETTRDSWAAYIDLSGDVTESLFMQAAARYEDYSDFGDELVAKVAGQYRINPTLALRASIGTGFRAPTPGQQGTLNISTVLPDGLPVARLIAPPSGDVARALGAMPLDAETSTNYTLGVTASVGDLALTVDFYRIDIEDRFFSPSPLQVSANAAEGTASLGNFENLADVIGFDEANAIGEVIFFQNAFDSKTTGVDVVATLPLAWENGQSTDLTFAYNYNKSEFDSDPGEFFGLEERFDFENADPNNRWTFTGVHEVGQFSVMGRVRFFGESTDSDDNSSGFTGFQVFDSTTFVDLEGSYRVNDMIRVSVGGRNIFDEFPDAVDRSVNDNDFCCGRVYRSSDFADWQGAFWYGRLTLEM